ncbi:sperm-tail PG-rich repeat containing 3 [Phyllostomus discolor]|uniref:Sperm-tail PG-rich repeat containing 3 n=1 Tax=Phyllostomus discolor TaxID=89673 RepID=A0A834BDP4_9CHIR|nr:sperm-tail PG-rich repeat containing 3 [Phyllostomus discolor]
MNFDQKAVKFLANFYINGGKHWTHGPLRLKSLVPAQPKDAVWRCPGVGAAWEMWPPAVVLESPEGLRMRRGPFQESRQNCTRGLKELWLEQRPPIVTDPDVPGPAKGWRPQGVADRVVAK